MVSELCSTVKNRIYWYPYKSCYNLPIVFLFKVCKPDQFTCRRMPLKCVDRARACNGIRDCHDGSDEANCSMDNHKLIYKNICISLTEENISLDTSPKLVPLTGPAGTTSPACQTSSLSLTAAWCWPAGGWLTGGSSTTRRISS